MASEGYRLWLVSRRAEVTGCGVGAGRRAARRIRLGSNCLRCRRCWLNSWGKKVLARVGDGRAGGERKGKEGGGQAIATREQHERERRDDHPLAFFQSLSHSVTYYSLTLSTQLAMSTSEG